MDTKEKGPSALSDSELLRIWRGAGGGIFNRLDGNHRAFMDEAKLLPFLREFVGHIRAEERDRCAKVATSYGDCGYECNKAIAEEICTLGDDPAAAIRAEQGRGR